MIESHSEKQNILPKVREPGRQLQRSGVLVRSTTGSLAVGLAVAPDWWHLLISI